MKTRVARGGGVGWREDREGSYVLKSTHQRHSAMQRWLVQTFKISFPDGSLATLPQNGTAVHVNTQCSLAHRTAGKRPLIADTEQK